MENAIRIGQVSQIDAGSKQVRVFFPDVEIMSGWLKVLTLSVSITVNSASGVDLPFHSHTGTASVNMPSVGDVVLCVYSGGFNSDGYVLGVIK